MKVGSPYLGLADLKLISPEAKMSNAELRQKICEKCIMVKGFNRETAFNDVRQTFTNAWRGTRATRTENYDFKNQEWIVQFFSIEGNVSELHFIQNSIYLF